MQARVEMTEAQKKLVEEQKAILKKYQEHDEDRKGQVAKSISVAADVEYSRSSTFGWGGIYAIDRFQSMLSGRAMTMNTQKKLDAAKLEETAAAPNPVRP